MGDTAPAASSVLQRETSATVDKDFKAAILAPGLQPGQLLEPVKSDIGWHVIQVMYQPPTRLDEAQDRCRRRRGLRHARPRQLRCGDRQQGRRPRLGGQEPARRTLSTPSSRQPIGKTSEIVAIDGRRRVPVQGLRRGGPDARRAASSRTSSSAFTNWYTAQKAVVIDRARSDDQGPRELATAPCWMPSWPRRDCAGDWIAGAGLQVVAAERLIAHADRAIAARADRATRAAPAGASGRRGRASPVGRWPAATGRRRRRSAGRPRPALPGRPPGRPVRGRGGHDGRRPRRRRPGRPALPRTRSHPRLPSPDRGRCPGSATACASPTAARGTASRPISRCAITCSRRRTRSTTRSRAARPPTWLTSSATCCSRSSSTRSWPRRRASST